MRVEIVLSIVLATSTVFYTLINLFMLIESIKVRKQKLSPLLVAYIASTEDHSIHVLKFKNIGEGLAKNVRVVVLKDYKQFGGNGSLISEFGIVKNGFNFFPPQYELQFYLDNPVEIFKNCPDGRISLEVSYNNIYGKKFSEVFILPFNQMFGLNYSTPPETYIGKISYYMKKINESLKVIRDNQMK